MARPEKKSVVQMKDASPTVGCRAEMIEKRVRVTEALLEKKAGPALSCRAKCRGESGLNRSA